ALLLMEVDIPVKIATALTYGIQTDTLNLYRARRADVIKTYSQILPRCDMRALARIQNPSRSRRFFKTLRKGMQNAMVRRGLIVSHLGLVENPDLVSQVAEFLLTYERSHWSLCTGRYKGKMHVSLRSMKPDAKAGEVLRDIFVERGKAGGHGAIAGGSLEVGQDVEDAVWEEIENNLIQRLVKRLRISLKSQFYFPFRNE
ncbi:MAG: DHHA1 domain-containing protein, partial [Chlamydiota bacterium]|nr:DHHA1 domain-containing protein [Chlamydiota bacterium]